MQLSRPIGFSRNPVKQAEYGVKGTWACAEQGKIRSHGSGSSVHFFASVEAFAYLLEARSERFPAEQKAECKCAGEKKEQKKRSNFCCASMLVRWRGEQEMISQ